MRRQQQPAAQQQQTARSPSHHLLCPPPSAALTAARVAAADITPVVKGSPAPGVSRHIPYGGVDMAGKLAELLAAKGVELDERDAARAFEQTACAAAMDSIDTSAAAAASAGTAKAMNATLADGRTISVSGEDREACVETLFQTRSWSADGSGASPLRDLQVLVMDGSILTDLLVVADGASHRGARGTR